MNEGEVEPKGTAETGVVMPGFMRDFRLLTLELKKTIEEAGALCDEIKEFILKESEQGPIQDTPEVQALFTRALKIVLDLAKNRSNDISSDPIDLDVQAQGMLFNHVFLLLRNLEENARTELVERISSAINIRRGR